MTVEARRIDLYDSIKPPTCTSCGKIIGPFARSVSFYCPNCGVSLIWRCDKCRTQASQYRCPNCGFTGP